uniref:serine/Arginine-related protein 53-like n=1 Tax=Myxine glutinosa TaxID=7769 RepID=UPI00358F39E9
MARGRSSDSDGGKRRRRRRSHHSTHSRDKKRQKESRRRRSTSRSSSSTFSSSSSSSSRSPSLRRRSSSLSTHSGSGSSHSARKRGRRSRSRDKSHRVNKSGSRTHSRRSRSRKHRRSRSRRRHETRGKRSERKDKPPSTVAKKEDICASIPGFENLSPAEQVKLRMQKAIEAAAKTDEVLKTREQEKELEKKKQQEEVKVSAEQELNRAYSVAAIESDSFTPAVFVSSRENKAQISLEEQHVAAIYGGGGEAGANISEGSEAAALTTSEKPELASIPTGIVYRDMEAVEEPGLWHDERAAVERWWRRLKSLRQDRLLGTPVG